MSSHFLFLSLSCILLSKDTADCTFQFNVYRRLSALIRCDRLFLPHLNQTWQYAKAQAALYFFEKNIAGLLCTNTEVRLQLHCLFITANSNSANSCPNFACISAKKTLHLILKLIIYLQYTSFNKPNLLEITCKKNHELLNHVMVDKPYK